VNIEKSHKSIENINIEMVATRGQRLREGVQGMESQRYVRPDWFTTHVFNPVVAWLTRMGISVYGSRVLAVRGRRSGEWRTTPVNLLVIDSQRYLVAPRGLTQWVRNIRASGEGELRVGRRRETIRVAELTDDEKPAILRVYLKRWKFRSRRLLSGCRPRRR
jgi:deazaflavin-dependent oxidoreductase (nitroreductase family)